MLLGIILRQRLKNNLRRIVKILAVALREFQDGNLLGLPISTGRCSSASISGRFVRLNHPHSRNCASACCPHTSSALAAERLKGNASPSFSRKRGP
jgi:hypothetical protein